jgi:hypothetical protein
MRKLKLELLQVESFETAPATKERGTMYAHQRPQKTSAQECHDTEYMDCTWGWSVIVTNCCALTEGVDCETAYCETAECETAYCETAYC